MSTSGSSGIENELPVRARVRQRQGSMQRFLIIAAVIAATVLAAGAIWTRVLAARAERDFPLEGRVVRVQGAALRYVERGTGSPIVLVHGAYGGLEDWIATGILDELARSHRVIAFDRPGHGWSERPSHGAASPIAQARILREALRELGVERPIVVGFSWGGAAALAWAVEAPDELAGVVVVNGVAYAWPGATNTSYVLAGLPVVGPLLAHTIAAPFGNLTAESSVARAFAPAPVASTFTRSPIPLALRPAQFLVEAEDMRLLKAAVAIQSPRYGEIRIPLSIVAGRGDLVAFWDFHSKRLHETVPTSEFTVLEGAGHQILHSHPSAVIEATLRLADRLHAR